ncbi:MAG: hypothetical protein V4596_01770, partial [Bdellovibrionota bacterium]
ELQGIIQTYGHDGHKSAFSGWTHFHSTSHSQQITKTSKPAPPFNPQNLKKPLRQYTRVLLTTHDPKK